ncbi:MAG: glucose-6-phosphate isomerase [Gammaproteobacteria bacterium]|nr:glucose-6-phosphate isomerase [Gammaproteobacteria bacterium]
MQRNTDWEKLKQHYQTIAAIEMSDLFRQDPKRFDTFSIEAPEIFLDYSKNRITHETLALLLKWAESRSLDQAIDALFSGKILNITEQREALHTALRNHQQNSFLVHNQNIMPAIRRTLAQMRQFVDQIHNHQWLGATQKPITDCVNVGIGGSDLGPRMATFALQPYSRQKVKCHFVSNLDGAQLSETLQPLNPETTLFIVASKTFTTSETLTNARSARKWLLDALQDSNAMARHFIAVSANIPEAKAFGIPEENIFEFWDWVGGRYSLWSAIGLPIALSIGMDRFEALLEGAQAMDRHFQTTAFEKNMPVQMGLLNIWYRNFYEIQTHAIIPYAHHLQFFPSYLQQLFMESNGKTCCVDGVRTDIQTGEIIWGGVGTDGQHAYHQWLHQGTQWVPVDFILPIEAHHDLESHHPLLFANCLAQSQVLLQGKTEQEAYEELLQKDTTSKQAKELAKHKVMEGNRPSNTLLIKKLTPSALGALIALYEHVVFVQGALWNINSFDQWGVELGKTRAKAIVNRLHPANFEEEPPLDSSTAGLMQRFTEHTKNS